MSRFNNPKALPAMPIRPSGSIAGVDAEPPRSYDSERVRATVSPPDRVFAIGSEAKRNTLQTLCFVVLNIYLLSGCANDLIFHFTGGKAYISAACVLLLPLLFLGTGAYLRGLQTPAGKWFAAFAVWLAIAAPFSFWKGGTATLLVNYIPRMYLVCFYLPACAVTLAQVRTMVRVVAAGALVVIMSCYAFGGPTADGRFAISGSLFYGNANELALQLLLGIIILTYVFFAESKFAKIVSAAGIVVSLSYVLKTGSRGALLATLSTGFVMFLMSRQRLAVVMVAVPALVIAFLLAPTEMRHRMALIVSDPQAAAARGEDIAAIASQMQREKLLRTSVYLAITNPVFGVGPGQFITKVAGEQEKRGEHADWLGTHNSYTQVASEAGLPALLFYVATIVTCMRMTYGLYRRSVGRPGLETIAGISFCMFLSSFAYSIATFFFHEAYGPQLPLIAGLSIALYLVAKPILERYEEAAV